MQTTSRPLDDLHSSGGRADKTLVVSEDMLKICPAYIYLIKSSCNNELEN